MAATDPDPDDLTDEQLEALADRVADRLDDRLGDGDLADSVTSRRRDILKGLAGGGVAAALGYSATSSAAAGSNQVGTVGAPGNLVDIEAEDISAASIQADLSTTTDENVLRVFGADADDNREFHADVPLSSFADIGAALQAVNDSLVAEGIQRGKILLPAGEHTYTTEPTFELPLRITGVGGPDVWTAAPPDSRNNTGTALLYQGSSTHAMELRGTANSPHNNMLNRFICHGWALVDNSSGSATHGLFLDGTTNTNANGSVVRSVMFHDWGPLGWNNGRGVDGRGTVFDVRSVGYASRDNQTGFYLQDVANATSGPPSQLTFTNPNINNTLGTAIDSNANGIVLLGGNVNGANSSPLINIQPGIGGIYGTHIEGSSKAGSTGLLYFGSSGPYDIKPQVVSRWATGVQIGDGTSKQTQGSRIDFKGVNNSSEDLKITNGGDRRGTRILTAGLTVTDERQSIDGVNDKAAVSQRNHLVTATFAVDSVGTKTKTVSPDGDPYETVDLSITDTSDGSGGTVSDFETGAPYTVNKSQAALDIHLPVITASSTSGATATVTAVFKRYTV